MYVAAVCVAGDDARDGDVASVASIKRTMKVNWPRLDKKHAMRSIFNLQNLTLINAFFLLFIIKTSKIKNTYVIKTTIVISSNKFCRPQSVQFSKTDTSESRN